MSRSLRSLLRLGAVLAVAGLALPGAALADQRLEEIDAPSLLGNVDASKVPLKGLTSLKATVMLPDGYDAQPDRRWPVVYLLAGIGDNSRAWADPGTGNIKQVAAGLPAIVVMPESSKQFNIDWWQGGARSGPNWMRYLLDEVIPEAESKYRILPGRANHVVAGASMGGYGALLMAGLLPSYFGTAVSMSGLVDVQTPESYTTIPSQVGAPYEAIWGPVGGAYAYSNNPIKVVDNVAHSRVYLSTGNGLPDATLPFKASAWTVGALIEGLALNQNIRYEAALRNLSVRHVLQIRGGVHDWPYWRREFPKAIQWGLFDAPVYQNDADASKFVYKSMQPHGNAWGFGYQFAGLPSAMLTLQRNGNVLKGFGTGTITINPGAADADASGNGTEPQCSFTTTLPFSRVIPPAC